MDEKATLNDSAITAPGEDRYGFDPFARALARSVAKMAAPEGMVLAINGPYGSGKSGVINLVIHHLQLEIEASRLRVVRFSPWWFDGTEALTRAFFEALQAALGGALRGRAKKAARGAINALYQRVKPGKQFGAIGANIAAGVPVGSAVVAAADLGVEYLNAKRSVENEYERLADALRHQEGRFLVVVDDIDRLDADQAITVFRLIKSVGRLPNVIYLLAFDSRVADHHLQHRFGEAASAYLEKIVQVSYELPRPGRTPMLGALLEQLNDVMPLTDGAATRTRFGNLLHDCVAPWLTKPRAAVRLASAVRVGWPAVMGEADSADFLALEAIKLAHPATYRAIQANPQALCGVEHLNGMGRRKQEDIAAEHDALLLAEVPEAERDAMRTALRRLFPRLDSVWANVWHDPASGQEARRHRLVCSRDHFDTYFLLAPGGNVVPVGEMAELLAQLGNPEYVRSAMLKAVGTRRSLDNTTRAALLLDELRLHVADVSTDVVPRFLNTLFQIADDLDVPEDRFLSDWGNQSRLSRLVSDLTRDRLNQVERSALLLDLVKSCQIQWLAWLADLIWEEHHPETERDTESEGEPLVTLVAAEALRAASLEAIREAARVGTLLPQRKLGRLLSAWANYAGDNGAQARRWTTAQLESDQAVVRLAEALTFLGERIGLGGQGFLGDRVATKVPQVSRAALARLCDEEHLIARARELLAGGMSGENGAILQRFVAGLQYGSK